MNGERIFTRHILDVATEEYVKVKVEMDDGGVRVYLADRPAVFAGVEIADGAVRAIMGPRAEIIQADSMGVIVEETP